MKTKMPWTLAAFAAIIIAAQIVLATSLNRESTMGHAAGNGADGAIQITGASAEDLALAAVPQATPQMGAADASARPAPTAIVGPDGKLVRISTGLEDLDARPVLTRVIGSPAIKPSVLGAGPERAAFTQADVRRFHEPRHTKGAGHFLSQVPTKIEKIEFATAKTFVGRDERFAQMLGSLGLPDNTLLCVVQYSGSFIGRARPGSTPPITPYALEIFDAHTGNRLMSSMLEALR